MRTKSSLTAAMLGVVIVLACFSYGAWRFERWWHYKFSYSTQVAEQMQPLVNRVTDLEKRIATLENTHAHEKVLR